MLQCTGSFQSFFYTSGYNVTCNATPYSFKCHICIKYVTCACVRAARGRGRWYIVACLQFDGSRRVERKPTKLCVCADLPADAPESGWVKSAPFSSTNTERTGGRGGRGGGGGADKELCLCSVPPELCVPLYTDIPRMLVNLSLFSRSDSLQATSRSAAGLLRVRK